MAQITVEARTAAELKVTAAYLLVLADLAQMRSEAVVNLPPRIAIGGAVIKREDSPETGLDPVAAFAPATRGESVPLPPPLPAVPAAPVSASATPAVPPAVPAPPAGGSVNPAGKQLDSRGLPHDGRIHSTPPTITDKGVWRKKRGLNDEALVHRIETELRAGQTVLAPVATPEASVPLPPVDLPAPPHDLASLLQRCAPMLASKALDMGQVIAACKAVGVESLAVLASRPDLVPAVWAALQQ